MRSIDSEQVAGFIVGPCEINTTTRSPQFACKYLYLTKNMQIFSNRFYGLPRGFRSSGTPRTLFRGPCEINTICGDTVVDSACDEWHMSGERWTFFPGHHSSPRSGVCRLRVRPTRSTPGIVLGYTHGGGVLSTSRNATIMGTTRDRTHAARTTHACTARLFFFSRRVTLDGFFIFGKSTCCFWKNPWTSLASASLLVSFLTFWDLASLFKVSLTFSHFFRFLAEFSSRTEEFWDSKTCIMN